MKSLLLILIYFGTFVLLYLIFSLFGLIWEDYLTILRNSDWLMFYTLFLGSWLAALPTHEIYEHWYKK